MTGTERVISYTNRVSQLSSEVKSMDVEITDQKLAMKVLCHLKIKFEHLIVAIDTVADDVTLTMDFVKSRLLQEEAQMSQWVLESPSGDCDLINETVKCRKER